MLCIYRDIAQVTWHQPCTFTVQILSIDMVKTEQESRKIVHCILKERKDGTFNYASCNAQLASTYVADLSTQ